jgi:hypothetical protein
MIVEPFLSYIEFAKSIIDKSRGCKGAGTQVTQLEGLR